MKTSKIIPFLIACWFCFSSCYMAVSENPLSDPDTPVFDSRLKGIWGDSREGGAIFFHFGKDTEDRTQIILVEHKKDGSLELQPFTMFPTVIERNFFMNIRFLNENGEMKKDTENYHFIKYDFPKTDRLSIAFMSSGEVETAIEKGDVVGIIHKKTVLMVPEDPVAMDPEEDMPAKMNEACANTEDASEQTAGLTITDQPENIVKFIKSADIEKLFPEPVILKRIK